LSTILYLVRIKDKANRRVGDVSQWSARSPNFVYLQLVQTTIRADDEVERLSTESHSVDDVDIVDTACRDEESLSKAELREDDNFCQELVPKGKPWG
jgi:hypothetical protein